MAYQYTCTICGTAFVRAKKKATVCSRDCFREFTSRLHGGKIMRDESRAKLSATKRERGALKPALTKACIHCGASFAISRYRNAEQREQAKFCGRECQFAYWRVHPRKPKPTMPPIERTCKHCGAIFTPSRAVLGVKTATARQFCSTAHMHAYQREYPDANPNWRGGRDPYYGPNWRYQARLARERDDHTCQDCGKRQERPRLPVHHIKARREFLDGDYRAANALANLITLCGACHRRRENAILTVARRANPENFEKGMRGEAHHKAKLTAADVAEIRRAFANGEADRHTLARRFGVTDGNVYMVIARKTWRHIA